MKTTTELRLRKTALVLTTVVLLQLVWIGFIWLLMSDPEPIVPAEASLRVDEIRYGVRLDEELSQALVSRPLFWEGRQAYLSSDAPAVAGASGEQPRGSAAIDKVKLLGVYSGDEVSGIIISYKGERRRLPRGESVAGWKFTMFSADSAVFESAGEKRVLPLEHAVPRARLQSKAASTNTAVRRANREKGEAAPDAATGDKANPEKGASNNQNDKGE